MKPESLDQPIRNQFQKLRRADERRAPSFARMWGDAVSQTQPDRRLRLPGPIALAVNGALWVSLVLFTLFLEMERDRQNQVLIQLSKSITEWKAPTDILLRSTNEQLLGQTPILGETYYQATLDLQ